MANRDSVLGDRLLERTDEGPLSAFKEIEDEIMYEARADTATRDAARHTYIYTITLTVQADGIPTNPRQCRCRCLRGARWERSKPNGHGHAPGNRWSPRNIPVDHRQDRSSQQHEPELELRRQPELG